MAADPNAGSLREEPVPYAPPLAAQKSNDELYQEEVLEARAMRPEDKLLAGEELFLYACSVTMAGIRNQFPHADDAEQRRILEERLELQRRLEQRG